MPVVLNSAVYDRLREIVASVLELDPDDVANDASFYEDLGASSLEKVEITVRVENDFGVRIAPAEAAEISCLLDAAALLERKGAGSGPVNLAHRLVGARLEAGRGGAIAYEDPELGEVSYTRLAEAARGYAAGLRAAGVPQGSRGLVVAEDSVATVAALLGLWWGGYVPVAVSALLSDAEIAFIAGDCAARVAHLDISAARQRGLAADLAALHQTSGDAVRNAMRSAATTTTTATAAADAPGSYAWPSGVEALLQYTSGTTGRPKGVRHCAAGIAAMLDGFGSVLGLTRDDVVLSTARMSFGYGFSSSILCPLDVGARVALIRGVADVHAVTAALERYRPTVLCSVPRIYAALLDTTAPEGRFSSLRLCLTAGEHCPELLAGRIHSAMGAALMNCLGATEVMHVVLATPPGGVSLGSVGFPVPGNTITVRDDDGLPVPDGTEGRLHVAGPQVALGYLERPEADAVTFADGGAYTGDLARFAPDGSVEYLCRGDDVLNLGGHKVLPGEIEDAIRAVAGVAECRVVPDVDEDGLELAVACVVVEGDTDQTAVRKSIRTALRRELGMHKRPSRIEFFEQLPETSTGKISARRLREQVAHS
jgi:acyl carrier protein